YWTVEGKWTVATFQKLGPDGQWYDLESVLWQGQPTYGAKDNFLLYGSDNYYRVRYETEDGAVNFSNLAVLRVDGAPLTEEVTVFPNPVPQSVDLKYDILSPKAGPLKISIYDAQGKLIWKSGQLAVEVGRNRVQVSTQLLAKGMYVTYIETPLKMYHRKFLVMENAQ
ncbi:MAG: T9SS type A sorting domain-containing protein, partial [Bacteroidetes bacterium]|nr:T9SS type A sorting domain-containing protein [Bacteroidota bacterium]